jgi:hypothetical protein
MTLSREDIEAAIRINYAAQRDAMVAGDADALGELLAEGFTLTHMTGYEQSRREWLDQVHSGEMIYHSIQDDEVDVDVHGEDPVLIARSRTEATIWGAHGVWPLELEIHYVADGDRWLAAYTVASTW